MGTTRLDETRTLQAPRIAATGWLLLAAMAVIPLCGCNREHRTAVVSYASAGYVYVTNNGDGTVSEFSRAANGGLIFRGLVKCGAVDGPVGIVVDPSNRFVYVANEGDHRIYEFSIRIIDGLLVPVGRGFVSETPGSRPQQIVISPRGDFAYVTNAGTKGVEGSIAEFAIDADSGALKALGVVRGAELKQPLGIAIAPGGKFVYVSDHEAGTILTFEIESSGALKPLGGTPSLGVKAGGPEMVTVNPVDGFVYAVDGPSGVATSFKVVADGKLEFQKAYPVGVTTADPYGIALATSRVGQFVYTGNRAIDTVSYFATKQGVLTLVGQSMTGLGGPTGMAVDPTGHFLYVVNRDAATVAQFAIVPVDHGSAVLVSTVFSEDPANESSHPLYIAMTH
jgi:6-phosphogluconolactonase